MLIKIEMFLKWQINHVSMTVLLNPTFQHRNLGLPEPPDNATKLDKNLHKLRLFQIVSDLYNCNAVMIMYRL